MGEAARGYSWPPFLPGHTASMKHGATSPRKVKPLADAITAELASMAPWSTRPPYAPTVRAWAHAEAMLKLLRDWLDEQGLLDAKGEPRSAVTLLERTETRAANLRTELGLSPLALARLLNAFTAAPPGTDDDALEVLKTEGRRFVESRTAPALGDGLNADQATSRSAAGDNAAGDNPESGAGDGEVRAL